MVYLYRNDLDLNDPSFQLNPDICQISSAAPIPILSNQTSPYNHHNQKEHQFDDLYIHNNRISSYTEFLTTDNVMEMEAYGIIAHATTCSTPESDYMFMPEDSKIKLEYEPLDGLTSYMSRTMSSDSCPELSCGQTPLTPIDSPNGPSPIIQPSCLPMSHHHTQYQQQQQQQSHMINEERDIMTNQVMIESSPSTTTKRGRGRRAATTTSPTTTTMSGIQLQDPQNYQLMGSSSLPSPPQKPTGKSRGRRMTNKPAKPGTKSFECTYAGCGRIFKRSEHLKRHIRSIHTLERPFHCPHPHCTKRFSRSDNLSQHVRVHRPNGKEKNTTTRTFSNFTPFLQTYPQTGSLQSMQ